MTKTRLFFYSLIVFSIFPLRLFATGTKIPIEGNYDDRLECIATTPEQNFLCQIRQLIIEYQRTETKAAINELAHYLNEVELNPRSYIEVFDGYNILLNNAVAENNYSDIIRYSNIVIDAFILKQDDFNSKLYPFYKARGIALFKQGVANPNPNDDWNRPSKVKFWIDSVTDLRKARVVYGKKESATDLEYMQTVAWDLAIDGYFRSMAILTNDELEPLRLKPIIQPSNAVIKTYSDHSIKCDKFGRISISMKVPLEFATGFKYGGAVAFYDLDKRNRIENVRVPVIVPNNSFAQSVKRHIEDIKFVPGSENDSKMPKECFKDRLALVRIIN